MKDKLTMLMILDGFGNNSNSNDTTQIIKNLDNLQNIVLSFKIQ